MSTAIPLEAFDTHDCVTFACPNEAERGDVYCSFCARQPQVAVTRIPPAPPDLRPSIMALLTALGRYEAEEQRRSGEDLLFARSELRKAMKRVVQQVSQT